MTDKHSAIADEKREGSQAQTELIWDQDNERFWLGGSTISKRAVCKLFNLLNAKQEPVEGLQRLKELYESWWHEHSYHDEDQCEWLQLPYEQDDIEIRKTLTTLGVKNLD